MLQPDNSFYQLYNLIVYFSNFGYYNKLMITQARLKQIRQMNLGRLHRGLFQWKVMRQSWEQIMEEAVVNGADLSVPHCCWLWVNKLARDRYPMFTITSETTGKPKSVYVRRFAYEAVFGPIPIERWVALYICKNPSCVNPFHATVTTAESWYADQQSRPEYKIPDNVRVEIEANKANEEKNKKEKAYRNRVDNIIRIRK